MSFNRFGRRAAGGPSFGVAVLSAAVAAAFALTHPAQAAAALGVVEGIVTCATSSACVAGNNTSTGPGVSGASSKGIGVTGSGGTGVSGSGSLGMAASGTTGIKATGGVGYGVWGISTTNDAVFGSSSKGTAGVAGTTPASYGVYGYTTAGSGGIGVYGSSVGGDGVYGITTNGTGIGIFGLASGDGYGNVGESGSGDGVFGSSDSGNGVQGDSASGYALYADAYGGGSAAYLTSASGYGLLSYSNGNVPLYARNSNGNGTDVEGTYIGLLGRAPASGGFPLVLTDENANDLFFVDGAGNVSYHGGLFNFARVGGGATVKSYSAKLSAPTVEDTGSAQLVAGAAAVRLDPTFAASIDAASSYRVFLTPDGDTRGLYVAAKTPGGFLVRETQGGRATLAFDYRIVATALGQAGQRMAVTSPAGLPRAAQPLTPKPPAAKRPAALARH